MLKWVVFLRVCLQVGLKGSEHILSPLGPLLEWLQRKHKETTVLFLPMLAEALSVRLRRL